MSEIPASDNLSQIVADGRVANYVAVASLTLLSFDHILTLGEEALIEHISGLTAARLRGSCGAFYHVEGIIITIIIGIVDFVLVVRVWTLYARSRRVLVFLVTLTILEFVAMMVVDGIAITIGTRGFRTLDVSTTPLCDTPNVALHFIMFYPVSPLIVTSIMFAMTLWKCASTLYEHRSNRMPILSLFLRDGIFWFFAVRNSGGLPELAIWKSICEQRYEFVSKYSIDLKVHLPTQTIPIKADGCNLHIGFLSDPAESQRDSGNLRSAQPA
ncbi:hypothetical protein BD779DRAFT_1667128 [Infundibulicybe gibba]|nr:hypothetical protein BD779DRAFT_1667128 [Infundibulicybe gibba]